MEIRDWLNIIALIIAPILALQIQKWLEKYREDRKRKLDIFKTLMSTRANRVSIEHVEALNMIDVEFYKKDKYKKVVKLGVHITIIYLTQIQMTQTLEQSLMIYSLFYCQRWVNL